MGIHRKIQSVARVSGRARFAIALCTTKLLDRIPLGALTGAAFVLALTAALGSSAAVAQSSPDTSGAFHYAIGQPVCQPAKPGTMNCLAMRRIEVTADTPGAMRYEIAAGANLSRETSGPAQTIGPHGGLTPSDIATAYGFSTTATGTGQTVAIVDAYNDPNIEADLGTFDTQYGLLACTKANGCLKIVNQSGGSTLPPNDTTGWATEIALDVETVHSLCQHCKIILVEATSNSNANLAMAENEAVILGATVISNSYGGPESGSSSNANAYNHPGVVIVASSGDEGYYSFDKFAETNQPNAPASLPTVVAVGGTSLYLGQTAARQSETVWNDNGTRDYYESLLGDSMGAAGGGCSTINAGQWWQRNLSNWAQTACGSFRLVSDISADADYLTGLDVYSSYDCGSSCTLGWETIGGTSLAAPIISSMFALAGGSHGIKYPALTLYGHLGSTSLYDVTSGGNGWCDGEGAATCGNPNTMGFGVLDCDYPAAGNTPSAGDIACDAGAGFDGPTGVGTPNGLGAFAATGPTVKISGPTTVTHNTNNTWTATTTDPFPAGFIKTYSWSWGDGTPVTVTTTGSAPHTYATGVYTLTLTVTDNYSVTGSNTYKITAN